MKLSDRFRSFEPAGQLAEHPRFFSDLDGKPVSGRGRETVIALADGQLSVPIPFLSASLTASFTRTGDRDAFQTPYLLRRDLLMFRADALVLTQDKERYFDPMLDALWAIMEESSWVLPAHQEAGTLLPKYNGADTDNLDILSAVTGGDLALVYSLLKRELDDFCPDITPRIDWLLRGRIIRPFMEENRFIWMKGINNWTPWIISNVFTVLIALPFTDGERAAVIRRAMPMLASFIDTYHEDGGCDEGPSYWTLAGASLFDCCELLYDLTDGRFNVYDDPLLRKMGEYIARVHISGDYYLNFADASGSLRIGGALVARFGQKVGSRVMEDFGRSLLKIPDDSFAALASTIGRPIDCGYRMAKDVRTMPEPLDDPPVFGEVWMDGLQVMAVREFQDEERRGLFFACKGGHNAENHNHNDVGSFVVYQDGEPLFPDLGVGTYTRETFLPDTRYKIFSMQSSYHNVIEFGGHPQLPGGKYRAEVLSKGYGMLSLDLTKAAPEEAKVSRWIRTMGLLDGEVRITDSFSLGEAETVCWHLIAFEKPEVISGGLRFNKAELRFDPSLTAEIEEHIFTDKRFIGAWKTEVFYRLVFSAPGKIASGDFTMTVRKR